MDRALGVMRETKIRFGNRAWELIQEEAEIDGVSASQFVREAAVARAIFMKNRRGDTEAGETIIHLIEALRENRR